MQMACVEAARNLAGIPNASSTEFGPCAEPVVGLMTEWVRGKTLDEALDIKNTHIAEELALPPVKIHCSILAEDAIKAAIEDYRTKHAEQAVQQPRAA
jgi:CTP synthase (UTP-ammonia lyase)